MNTDPYSVEQAVSASDNHNVVHLYSTDQTDTPSQHNRHDTHPETPWLIASHSYPPNLPATFDGGSSTSLTSSIHCPTAFDSVTPAHSPPSSANPPASDPTTSQDELIPPEYTPSATLPPSYWSGEACGVATLPWRQPRLTNATDSDSERSYFDEDEDDDETLNGEVVRREVDFAVMQARILRGEQRLMAGVDVGGRIKRLSRGRKWWKKVKRLSRLHWWALFLLNWDVIMNIALLLSTIILVIPSTFANPSQPQIQNSNDYQQTQPQLTTAPLSEYLILLIPLIFCVVGIASKKAYTRCNPSTNPMREEAVPPTHFLKLYNFYYLIRIAMDVAACVRYAGSGGGEDGTTFSSWWEVSGIRMPLAIGTGGVALFFDKLFPCDAGIGGVDQGSNGAGNDSWTDSFDWFSSSKRRSDGILWDTKQHSSNGNASVFTSCVGSGIVFPTLLIMLSLRIITLLFLFYYTQRLTNRLLKRLERNLGQAARANIDFGRGRQLEMRVMSEWR